MRRVLTLLGVVLNLALIGFYKYAAFIVESLNWTIETQFDVPDIILPIGISFFTFQQISLLVDAYKGRVAQLRFWDHVLFIAFFPQLIAGPIVRQHDMLPQLAARRNWTLRADYLAIDIALFAFGLFKKAVLIDPFVPYLDLVYQAASAGDAIGFVDGWVAGIGYGFQVYFDFSAYSDMAIGLGFMFGLRLPNNFFSNGWQSGRFGQIRYNLLASYKEKPVMIKVLFICIANIVCIANIEGPRSRLVFGGIGHKLGYISTRRNAR